MILSVNRIDQLIRAMETVVLCPK